ncbi:MAG: hypothetical protein JWL76_2010 [Thermoleophilia bacterium]|nr:hypothetical protein [Thermoleophilia bacterium]
MDPSVYCMSKFPRPLDVDVVCSRAKGHEGNHSGMAREWSRGETLHAVPCNATCPPGGCGDCVPDDWTDCKRAECGRLTPRDGSSEFCSEECRAKDLLDMAVAVMPFDAEQRKVYRAVLAGLIANAEKLAVARVTASDDEAGWRHVRELLEAYDYVAHHYKRRCGRGDAIPVGWTEIAEAARADYAARLESKRRTAQ